MFLGIEIGGTKLQLGLGEDSGRLAATWRADVDRAEGGAGIRAKILEGIPQLLASAALPKNQVKAVGIGFGGPVDDATRRTITSHQVEGWDDFALAEWLESETGWPVALGNDADVAALGEATHGAGRRKSPVFYMTIGTGIGGGLVIDGKIFRGTGRGAVEIGHVPVRGHRPDLGLPATPLEQIASGLSIGRSVAGFLNRHDDVETALREQMSHRGELTGSEVVKAALAGDGFARKWLDQTFMSIADGLNVVITLFCPKVIVLGGGVSLAPDELFLDPIRKRVAECGFKPFTGLTEIVKAELGEEVVLHGAIALASRLK